jgi:hypothetical protein
MLNISAGYFNLPNPLLILDRWINPYINSKRININEREISIKWTKRADQQFSREAHPIRIELRLYFSCVVKKQVIFHRDPNLVRTDENSNFELVFRAVTSAVCDPEEFAASFPEGQLLDTNSARKMVPKHVRIDFRQDQWIGEFYNA